MKQISMIKVVVEYSSKGQPTQDVVYVEEGVNYREGWGIPVNTRRIISDELVQVSVFEAGDRVTAEVHRETQQNEDGIVTGGAWCTKAGVVESVNEKSPTHGFLRFDDGDVQAISLIQGDRGYPGQNIQPEGER